VISYVGGDGNDVVLETDPVEIPSLSGSALVLLMALLGTMAWFRITN
jgi:hypothetical protein